MRAAAYGSASATALSALPDEQEAVDSVGRLLLRMISSHERAPRTWNARPATGQLFLDQMTADFTAAELKSIAGLLVRFNDGVADYYSSQKGATIES